MFAMNVNEIDKLAWLCIKDTRILVVRSKGNDTYYIPGGKREEGESDYEALIREVKEELSVDLMPETIKYAKTFKAQAHGKPNGVQVKMTCYFAEFSGAMKASAEIEEASWINHDDEIRCSLVTKMIMDWLKSEEMIKSKSVIPKFK